jgi:pyruvate dehydrogenase E1 component
MPEGAADGILRGMYLLRDAGASEGPRAQLFGSGAILREVLAAADLLEQDWNVRADVWSVTSFNLLQRDGVAAHRWNMLHPGEKPKRSFVESLLEGRVGPAVAATDYVRTFAEQIRPFLNRRYTTLGTDGYGRSDFRRQLRAFFEVDRHYVALAALSALAAEGAIAKDIPAKAIAKYEIAPSKPNPITV